jgi:hypothetical protein
MFDEADTDFSGRNAAGDSACRSGYSTTANKEALIQVLLNDSPSASELTQQVQQ